MTWYGLQTNADFCAVVIFFAFWLNRIGNPYRKEHGYNGRCKEQQNGCNATTNPTTCQKITEHKKCCCQDLKIFLSIFSPFEAVQIFFSFALVFVGLLQYCVYRYQATIMAEQTKIAAEQAQISRDQARPQLYFKEKTFHTSNNGKVAIENDGGFVASDVYISGVPFYAPQLSHSDFPHDKKVCERKVENPQNNLWTKVIIRPKDHADINMVFPTVEDPAQNVPGRRKVFLLGCIGYRWGFDTEKVLHTWFSVPAVLYERSTGKVITLDQMYSLQYYLSQDNIDASQLALRVDPGAEITYFDEDEEQ